MPKGDNLKGPFKGLPHEGGAIASILCDTCTAGGPPVYADVKVDGHGWIVANCHATERCGARRGARSMASVKALFKKSTAWRAGAKKPAYEIAGMITKEDAAVMLKNAAKPYGAPQSEKPIKKRRDIRVFGVRRRK